MLVELSAGGTGAERSVLVEPRAAEDDGTDDVRPSLVELAAPDGAGAEQSVLVESCAATGRTGIERSMLVELDGTGIEQSVLVESRGTAGGTDDELLPGEKGGGEEQGGDI